MSNDSLFSNQWHRVRNVCPRLASDVDVSRHVYRGRPTYVMRRRAVTSFHHLDAVSFELVGRLDGEKTVAELWEQSVVELDQNAPTQDEWIGLLAELYSADLLVVDRRVPTERLFDRREENKNSERRSRYLNPLYLRFSLHDPEEWLNRIIPFSKWLFSRNVALIWFLLLVVAGISMVVNADELWRAMTDGEIFSSRNAILFLLLYPPLKFLHEFAHALAVKRCGGEVHETGISLMVLLPLPYVDASASSFFADKYDRMLVSAAGILVELACAAIGVLLWANTSGVLQDIGLVMFMVGGLSTLLLNGNPLLKFDGYYLLADWIEIPNLAARSRQAVLGSLSSLVTGSESTSRSDEGRGEIVWLHVYGVCSAIYRTALIIWIAWMLSERWFFVGVMLALFALFVAIVLPLKRLLSVLIKDPVFHSKRSILMCGVIPLLLAVIGFWLPLPHSNVITGVVWIPDEAVIRVSSDCDINEVHVQPGTMVKTGDSLFSCENPDASAKLEVLVARVDELQTRRAAAAARDTLAVSAVEAELIATQAALDDIRERISSNQFVAKLDGLFDVVDTSALQGRAFSRGDLVGYVVPNDKRTVRLAIDERWITRFDNELQSVSLRVNGADGRSHRYETTVLRRTPKATRVVASAALSTFGGGPHIADENGDGRLLKEAIFDIELVWPDVKTYAAVGSHVGVRLVYSPTPLSVRLRTTLRQAFSDRVTS